MCELLQIGITFSGFSANLHEEGSQQLCGNRGGRLYRDTSRSGDMMKQGRALRKREERYISMND